MHSQPHIERLSTANHHDWTLFGFTSVLRLLTSVDLREIEYDLMQPTLYGIETTRGPLPECTLLHYLRNQSIAPSSLLSAFKQLAVGLRYATLVGLDLDDVYVDEPAVASGVSSSSSLRLHIIRRRRSVLCVDPDPQQHARPDGGIFIQAGHPLAWFEVGPTRAVSDLALSAVPRRPRPSNGKAVPGTAPWLLLHAARSQPETIWAWAPSLVSAVADFNALSAAASHIHLAH